MRRLLFACASAVVLALGPGAGVAAAEHPCHENRPCGHTCIVLWPPFVVDC